jgi:pilus assembly protein Flp/PilA
MKETESANVGKDNENVEVKRIRDAFPNWLPKCFRSRGRVSLFWARVALCGATLANTMKGTKKMKNLIKRLWKEEEGQDLIEYALLVALIALGAAAVFPTIGTTINTIFTNANACISTGKSCNP